MSIWGKVIGGVTGFALGGPFGALMGAFAGHAMDRMRSTMPEGTGGMGGGMGAGSQDHQVAFTMAVIVLGAKLAKVDGRVTSDEVAAFRKVFNIPSSEAGDVGRLFNEAKQDAQGFEPYAQQIAGIFVQNRVMLEELLGALFHIAMADGMYHPAEKDYLSRVAAIFGFSQSDFRRLEDTFVNKGEAENPYQILDINESADNDEIKKHYRKLILENHPDKLMAQGLPQEFIDLANERMATFNAAYDKICKLRGIK